MRLHWIFACTCAFLVLASYSGAGLPITTIAGDPPPTTAPAEPVGVLLLPFRVVGQNGDYAWISEAIQEDLAHDLSRNHAIRVIRPATTQPVTDADGLATARDLKAQRVISGSYQVVDDQLRITGSVIDVDQTQPASPVKATGRVRDLFKLEDALAMQLWNDLPRPTDQASTGDFQVTPLEDYTASQQEASPPPPVIYEPQPDVAPAPDYGTAPDYYPYDSGYPYGYFGYGYGLGGSVFIGGFGRGFNRGGHFGGGGGFHSTPHTVGPRVAPSSGFGGGGAHAGGGMAFGGRR
jgi:TolB-like protein